MIDQLGVIAEQDGTVTGILTPMYAISVLFAGLVSPIFATVDVLIKYPVAVDVVADITISGNDWVTGILSVLVQVMLFHRREHTHPVPLTPVTVIPAGIAPGSVTVVVPDAISGPLLVTRVIYVNTVPVPILTAVPCVCASLAILLTYFLIERSKLVGGGGV